MQTPTDSSSASQSRSTELVAVPSGPETTSATTMAVVAYVAMWALVFGFLVQGFRRQRRVDERLAEVHRALAARDGQDAQGGVHNYSFIYRFLCAPPVTLSFLAVVCVALTYVHPLNVAKRENVLDGEHVRAIVMATAKSRLAEDPSYQAAPIGSLVLRERALAAIRSMVDMNAASLDLNRIKEAGNAVDALNKLNPPPKVAVKFLGFVESKVHYIYFCALFFLICHLRRTISEMRGIEGSSPIVSQSVRTGRFWETLRVAAAASVFFVFSWQSPNYLRAYELDNYARTVFSFVHRDVGPCSYYWQIVRSVVVCVLIGISCACSWQRAKSVAAYVKGWRVDSTDPAKPNTSLACLELRAEDVRELFRSWQFHSLFLVGAFLPWAYYYWGLDDSRYYMSNLAFQVIWGITWWCATSPVIHAARAFDRYRDEIIRGLVSHSGYTDIVKALREQRPVSFFGVLSSGLTAVATYLTPMLHKIFS